MSGLQDCLNSAGRPKPYWGLITVQVEFNYQKHKQEYLITWLLMPPFVIARLTNKRRLSLVIDFTEVLLLKVENMWR